MHLFSSLSHATLWPSRACLNWHVFCVSMKVLICSNYSSRCSMVPQHFLEIFWAKMDCGLGWLSCNACAGMRTHETCVYCWVQSCGKTQFSRSLSRHMYTSILFWTKHMQDFERAWPPPEGASKLREFRAQKSHLCAEKRAQCVCVCVCARRQSTQSVHDAY